MPCISIKNPETYLDTSKEIRTHVNEKLPITPFKVYITLLFVMCVFNRKYVGSEVLICVSLRVAWTTQAFFKGPQQFDKKKNLTQEQGYTMMHFKNKFAMHSEHQLHASKAHKLQERL